MLLSIGFAKRFLPSVGSTLIVVVDEFSVKNKASTLGYLCDFLLCIILKNLDILDRIGDFLVVPKLSVISTDEELVFFSSIVALPFGIEIGLLSIRKAGSGMPVVRRIFLTRFVFDFMCSSDTFSELLLLSTTLKMSCVVAGLIVVLFANVLCTVVELTVLLNMLMVVEAVVAVHFLLVDELRPVVVSLLDMSSFCVAPFVEVEVKSIVLVVLF